MIKTIKLLTFIVTIICTGLVIYNLLTKEVKKIEQRFVLKSNKPIFEMEVDRDYWNQKLEPGRYTKSGILIIKQNGN
jgi:hypothetical protein